MSGVRRFLSRRDKSPSIRHSLLKDPNTRLENPPKQPRNPDPFDGVFTHHHDPEHKPSKEEEKTIKGILERLRRHGIDHITEANVEYALHGPSSKNDADAAFRMLLLLEDTYEGIIRPYNPDAKLVGAVNREGVTCYLDALLFSMFARLDGFEAMLYENFDDIKRRRLAGLLRLWVNMLRTGRLITTDITARLQEVLADAGWTEAGDLRQQDPSEAFTFITGQLELPMLTLKMDMFHTGKEDPQDDHKFIHERLLEVALLDRPVEGASVVTLEDCLEHYFNNRIEVKRHLENQRRNTLKSAQAVDTPTKVEKDSATHIEVFEVSETPIAGTPTVTTPLSDIVTPSSSKEFRDPLERLRPSVGRKRADSIFSQRKTELIGIDPERPTSDESITATRQTPSRKMSMRTEVLMPAWQFFRLLPWYTENLPTSDAQVAAHFSKKRPVLGICLKRYSYTNAGQARRLDTYVDIPLEIAVPNFVSDDNMKDEGPLIGNFKLLLQSVVCHRGVSVNSGHYICLCRGRAGNATRPTPVGEERGSDASGDEEDSWMRFDDMAQERISYVDIHDALKQETPYLLFYQVLPIDDDEHSLTDLPSYSDAISRTHSPARPLEKAPSDEPAKTPDPSKSDTVPVFADSYDFAIASTRTSIDADAPDRGRAHPEARRTSVTFDTNSTSGSILVADPPTAGSIPTTPLDEKSSTNLLALARKTSRRGSRVSTNNSNTRSAATSRSRPTSAGPGDATERKRFSMSMSRLTQRMSRLDADSGGNNNHEKTNSTIVIEPSEHVAAELAGGEGKGSQGVSAVSLPATTNERNAGIQALPRAEGRAAGKGEKLQKKHHLHNKRHEERDCVVM